MKRPGDKYLNRLADAAKRTGKAVTVLMFGARWLIMPGRTYAVRVRGEKRSIVELIWP